MQLWLKHTAARLDDMGGGVMSLRVEQHRDGDVALYIEVDGAPIEDENGNKSVVEFCTSGGRSPKTRVALMALFAAMREDDKQDPDGTPAFPFFVRDMMRQHEKSN